jgi:hypothetical protein
MSQATKNRLKVFVALAFVGCATPTRAADESPVPAAIQAASRLLGQVESAKGVSPGGRLEARAAFGRLQSQFREVSGPLVAARARFRAKESALKGEAEALARAIHDHNVKNHVFTPAQANEHQAYDRQAAGLNQRKEALLARGDREIDAAYNEVLAREQAVNQFLQGPALRDFTAVCNRVLSLRSGAVMEQLKQADRQGRAARYLPPEPARPVTGVPFDTSGSPNNDPNVVDLRGLDPRKPLNPRTVKGTSATKPSTGRAEPRP